MSIYVKVGGTWRATNNDIAVASSSVYGLVKSGSMVSSNDGLTPCPIIGGIPYYKINPSDFYKIDTVEMSWGPNGENKNNKSVTCGFTPSFVIVYREYYDYTDRTLRPATNVSITIKSDGYTLYSDDYGKNPNGSSSTNAGELTYRCIAFR